MLKCIAIKKNGGDGKLRRLLCLMTLLAALSVSSVAHASEVLQDELQNLAPLLRQIDRPALNLLPVICPEISSPIPYYLHAAYLLPKNIY